MKIIKVNLEKLVEKSAIKNVTSLGEQIGISTPTILKYKTVEGIKTAKLSIIEDICTAIDSSFSELIETDKDIKIPSEVLNTIKNYPSSSFNLDTVYKEMEIIESLNTLYKFTKRELSNYFTLNEVHLLTAATNSLLYSAKSKISPKVVLGTNINDSIELDDFDMLYNVDKSIILGKLNNLSEFQSYTVLNMCFEFWSWCFNNPGEDSLEMLKQIFLIIP